jgi:hypothetical protein
MHRHQQYMIFLTHADQPAPHQRPGVQVERRTGFFIAQAFQFFFCRMHACTGRVPAAQSRCRPVRCIAPAAPSDQRKGGAQGFVACHDAVQRTLQGGTIERALHAQAHGHVIRLAHPFHLRQEPQALLRIRQRQRLVSRGQRNGRQLACTCLRNRFRQIGQYRRCKQFGNADFDAQHFTYARHHPHRQQRVAAQTQRSGRCVRLAVAPSTSAQIAASAVSISPSGAS